MLKAKLICTKYDESCSMREHFLEMIDLVKQLKTLKIVMDEFFLIHFTLSPQEYGPFQINYNNITDKWTFDEMTIMLVQEKARSKQYIIHTINVIT